MTTHQEGSTAWVAPTRLGAAWFLMRVWGHVSWRGLQALWKPPVRSHPASDRLQEAPVVAEHRSDLWRDGRDDEFLLVAGKVQNLRLARSAFDGIVVPAGSTFSFWRQLGRPSRWRGFVEGREIRAGCVVPTIAGGLCQLSNALASCAIDGGLVLTERHGHTAFAERNAGPATTATVDATVFWNYVDLRFVADFDVRIEVEMSSDELIVRMRAEGRARPGSTRPLTLLAPMAADAADKPVARGCLTCDEVSCFRHRTREAVSKQGTTAILVNAWTPEFARHLDGTGSDADWFMPWVRPSRRPGGAWTPAAAARRSVAVLASVRRTLLLRRHANDGGARQAAILEGDRWLAHRYARRLKAHHTHLVIDQSLLIPLVQCGALAGRTYEVFVHALPASELQRRLDLASRCWPAAPSLKDFRVDDARCAMESAALRASKRLVTPHVDVAAHLRATLGGTPIDMVDWVLPPKLPARRTDRTKALTVVVFPASALARKGAHEMAEAVRRLGWRLMVLGSPTSDPLLWHGVDVVHGSYRDPGWVAQADVVALPAHVEHAPRGLLAAIAHGVPVVTTPACGLPTSFDQIEVPAGDVPALIAALQRALSTRACQTGPA
jgi:glycosyltransferase involved in cell wall biosynthesis